MVYDGLQVCRMFYLCVVGVVIRGAGPDVIEWHWSGAGVALQWRSSDAGVALKWR